VKYPLKSKYFLDYSLTLITAAIFIPIYWVGCFSRGFILIASTLLFPAIAAVAVLVSFAAVKRYGWREGLSKAVACLFTASLCWLSGESAWAFYVLALGVESPYPSYADIFFLAGYVAVFLAFFYILRFFGGALPRGKVYLIILMDCLFALLVSALIIRPVMASEMDFLEKALNIVYPLLDIVLFTAGLSCLFIFLAGRIGLAWFFLALSLLMDVAADMLFSYVDALGLYYEGHPVELFYLWAYLLFILGLRIHLKEL